MKYFTLFAVLLIFVAIGCNDDTIGTDGNSATKSSSPTIVDSTVLKIYIYASGGILVNGKTTSVKKVDTTLSILKAKNGTVYYARENAEGKAPAEALMLIDLISKYELPIKFYNDKEFAEPYEELNNSD